MPRYVGESVKRYDITTKVQGQRKYPQDFDRDGQLYAKVVWSPHPHAIVTKIDTTDAEALPGVVKVITYHDVPVNEYGINIMDQSVLVAEGSKVRWMGDRIALVVAESERIAEQAQGLVKVEYDPLPIVSDPREGIKPEPRWCTRSARAISFCISNPPRRSGSWFCPGRCDH